MFPETKKETTEGPQHFAFPEISRETRGCLELHSVSFEFPSGKSRVSLESESWSGAKSEAKMRKSANYPGIFQVYPKKIGRTA